MLISNNVGVMNNAESIRTWKQTPVEISFASRLVEKNYAPVVESVDNERKMETYDSAAGSVTPPHRLL
jgi:hypothetical protein